MIRKFIRNCRLADPYPQVPWLDRDNNLIFYVGYRSTNVFSKEEENVS